MSNSSQSTPNRSHIARRGVTANQMCIGWRISRGAAGSSFMARQDEIRRPTGDGAYVVFDGVGEADVWRSFQAPRDGGRLVAYGFTSFLRNGVWRGDGTIASVASAADRCI